MNSPQQILHRNSLLLLQIRLILHRRIVTVQTKAWQTFPPIKQTTFPVSAYADQKHRPFKRAELKTQPFFSMLSRKRIPIFCYDKSQANPRFAFALTASELQFFVK